MYDTTTLLISTPSSSSFSPRSTPNTASSCFQVLFFFFLFNATHWVQLDQPTWHGYGAIYQTSQARGLMSLSPSGLECWLAQSCASEFMGTMVLLCPEESFSQCSPIFWLLHSMSTVAMSCPEDGISQYSPIFCSYILSAPSSSTFPEPGDNYYKYPIRTDHSQPLIRAQTS